MKKISIIFLSLFSAYAVAMDEQKVASTSYVPAEVPAASEAAPSALQAFLERFTTKASAKETTPVVVAPEVSAPVLNDVVKATADVAKDATEVVSKVADTVATVAQEAAEQAPVKISDASDSVAQVVANEKTASIFKRASEAIKKSTKTCVDKCVDAVVSNQSIVAYALVGTGVSAGVWLYCNEQEEAGIAVSAASIAGGIAVHPTSRAYILAAVSAVHATVKKCGSATAQYVAKHPVVVGITATGAAVVAIGACVYVVAQNGEQVEVAQVA